METLTIESSTLRSDDGLSLATRTFTPPNPVARLLVVHGYAEHKGRYEPLARLLASRGIESHLLDLRGHGESEGARGHVDRFDGYRRDLALFVRATVAAAPSIPTTLLGHSLGGLIALDFAAHGTGGLQSLVVTSPFLAPAFEVPLIRRALARIVSPVLPRLRFDNLLDPSLLTRDPEEVRKYREDPLVLKTTTPRWFTEVMKAQHNVLAAAPRITLPTLFLLAGEDRIADRRVSEAMFRSIPNPGNQIRIYAGFYHEVLNETGRDQVIRDLLEWLQKTAKNGK